MTGADVTISLRDSENRELARLTRYEDTNAFQGPCAASGKAIRLVVVKPDGEEWAPNPLAPPVVMSGGLGGHTVRLQFPLDSVLAGCRDIEDVWPSGPRQEELDRARRAAEDSEPELTRDVLPDEIDEDPPPSEGR